MGATIGADREQPDRRRRRDGPGSRSSTTPPGSIAGEDEENDSRADRIDRILDDELPRHAEALGRLGR